MMMTTTTIKYKHDNMIRRSLTRLVDVLGVQVGVTISVMAFPANEHDPLAIQCRDALQYEGHCRLTITIHQKAR
jgi:hypothetical protein